jgi:hypothetical protein
VTGALELTKVEQVIKLLHGLKPPRTARIIKAAVFGTSARYYAPWVPRARERDLRHHPPELVTSSIFINSRALVALMQKLAGLKHAFKVYIHFEVGAIYFQQFAAIRVSSTFPDKLRSSREQ